MPFYADDTLPAPRVAQQATPVTPPDPSIGETIAAAFRQDNPITNVVRALNRPTFEREPDHNPLDVVRGTPFEANHLDKFVGSQSVGETRAIMSRIDEEEQDRKTLDASGFAGTVAQIGAGLLDPTTFLPGGAIYRGVRGGQAAVRSAVSVGAMGAVATAAQEAVLQSTQETRSAGETAVAIGSATLLSAMIGAGASALLSKGERQIMEAALDRTRAEMDAHAAGAVDTVAQRQALIPRLQQLEGEASELARARDAAVDQFGARSPEATAAFERLDANYAEQALLNAEWKRLSDAAAGSTSGSSAGAAATDTRQLDLVGHGLGMTDFMSPLRRTLSIDDDVIKRDIVDLVEPPYRFEGNLEGQATSQAPSVQRQAYQAIYGTRAVVDDEVGRLFADYRFGQPDITIPGVRAQYERFRGTDGGKMTKGEFLREASKAAMFGDKHDIPQVAQAAQAYRKIFDQWGERAEKVLPGFKRTTDADGESYFPHYWNKERIRALKPEFVNKITEHYQADQSKKAAAKERLEWQAAQLRSWEQQAKKLEARFGRIEDRIEGLETRASERGMEARATEDRAETVEARQGRIADEAAELDVAISLMEKFGRNHPTLGPVLQRTQSMFETRSRQHDLVGGVADEARRGERRNFKRLDVLKERLSDAAERKALIEEYRAAAQQTLDEVRAKIEAEIAAWEGKSTTEAKSAMKSREKYAKETARADDAPRLTSADSAIDRAVKRIIESDRDLSLQELRSRASETANRILGSPDGRLPYDMGSGGPQIGVRPGNDLRGSESTRQFAVSNKWAQDWLEDDMEQVSMLYLRTLVPDVLIAERFGDVNMEQVFRRINERYDARTDATGPGSKERLKLDKEKNMVIERVAAFRDRIRGTYGWSPEASMQNMARYGNAAKLVNNLTSMGVAAVSSLPDMAGVVFRHGFGTAFRDGWSPFFRSLTDKETAADWAKHKSQWRAFGIGVEVATNARQHSLDDVMDVYRPQSKWERVLQYASDKFFIANLLAPETDMLKLIAAHVSVSELLRSAFAVRGGKATKAQIAMLAENSISLQAATKIADQFETHGGISEKGVRLPNLADWTDRAAADSLAGAVGREVDIAVVTPGQEKPISFSKPVFSVFTQFKNFTAASTERVLIANLQRRDANTVQGLVASVGLGMLSYKLNSLFGGQETSDRPQDWFKEGVSRGGVLGWLEEGNTLASKVSRGGIDVHRLYGADKPASRYVSRSAVDMLLGPTAGKLKDAFQVTGSAASRDWSESDTKALRRMVASQNLFYVRGLLNKVEESANAKLGIQ